MQPYVIVCYDMLGYMLCYTIVEVRRAQVYVAAAIGWHYLSNAACLIRPRLFYALSVVSRTIINCYMIHHV